MLGLAINLKKYQTVLTQKIRIFGFVIDSVKMIVTLAKEKMQILKTKVLRTTISCMPAGIIKLLFYLYLENEKVTSFRLNKGNYDTLAKICTEGKQELKWWLDNTDGIEKPISLI